MELDELKSRMNRDKGTKVDARKTKLGRMESDLRKLDAIAS